MKTLLIFIFILFVALGLSALLNPVVYLLLGDFAPQQNLITTPAKFIALPLVFLAAIYLRVGQWKAVGFTLSGRDFWRELMLGWVTGTLVMAGVVLMLLLLGVRALIEVDASFWFNLVRMMLVGLAGGLLVALIEETFVRGVMFSAMRRESSILFSVIATSGYFALLHFINPQPLAEGASMGWASGLVILAGSFDSWMHPLAILDSLASLVAAGVLLALLREYRGNLIFVIGMHAGWVFVIKVTKSMTWVNDQSEWLWGVGSYDDVTGWFSFGWLVVLILLYLGWLRLAPEPQKKLGSRLHQNFKVSTGGVELEVPLCAPARVPPDFGSEEA